MALEIEHKFLVNGKDYKSLAEPTLYRQGYLSIDANKEIRVRMAGEKCCITVKSKINETMRHEFEYTIPVGDAQHMLDQLCNGFIVEKYRYRIPFKGMIWEVDEFLGDNADLVIAEIELTTQGQTFEKPAWVGREVSGDDHYLNAALALNPYKNREK
jgi:adenylate cyclase